LKFFKVVEQSVLYDDLVIDGEREHDDATNFSVLDRLARNTCSICLDWEISGIVDAGGDDDNDFTGIQKHLEITQDSIAGGNIDRVEVLINTPRSREETSSRRDFFKKLITVARTSPNIWKPSVKELVDEEKIEEENLGSIEFENIIDGEAIREALSQLTNQQSIPTSSISKIALDSLEAMGMLQIDNGKAQLGKPGEPRVYVARDKVPSKVSSFMESVYRMNPQLWLQHCSLREIQTLFGKEEFDNGIPLSSWTSLDGDLREPVLADLLVNLLVTVFSNPGMNISGVMENSLIIPPHEVKALVAILVNTGLVEKDNDGNLYLAPISEW
jgi:hypothetical protein